VTCNEKGKTKVKVQDVFIYFIIAGRRIAIHNRTRDPFFTHPPKLQACTDDVRTGTEKAESLGEFNDMLSGARLQKVQKARVITFLFILNAV
jgi:hypothetical protein